MMALISNEQVKLTATALNNVAVGTVVTGLVVPAIAFGYGLTSAPARPFWWLVAFAWFSGGLALHIGARFVLRGLQA